MDEPFSAVDETTVHKLLPMLITLDKTVIMVTHSLTPELGLFDEVLIMENGKLVEYGPYSSVKNSDAYLRVRDSERKK